jgi:2-hydroxychromene-2-carboxylate isomerase
MTALDFWYEFGSTYSYPAAMRIERLAEAAHVEVRWRPFLLGPIFKAYGWNDSPFNIYSAKGRYMWRDLQRICEAEGLPLKLPPVQFPQNGLKAARLALVGERQGWTPAFSRAVFVANYAEQKDISDKETLGAILRGLGVDAEAALVAANAAETKEALKT